MGCHVPPLEDVAVRLADEGVPLCAIARATRIPSDTLRSYLHEALSTGDLLSIPREDWPPGFPRDQRALQLSRLVQDKRVQLNTTIAHIFSFTPSEVGIFISMLQHEYLDKSYSEDFKILRVQIYNMRNKLKQHDIHIRTVWGQGYRISSEDRQKAIQIITNEQEYAVL